jgi:hypothetical protein
MNLLSIAIFWVTLFAGTTNDQHNVVLTAPTSLVVTTVNDPQRISQAVIAFLQWYKAHLRAVNRFPLVNQQAGKPYSVNVNNGERYLTLLKTSHLLTDTYLSEWRTYFRERNEGFRLSPQDEGPPNGFEYDLVMLTQDVDKQLAALKSLKVNSVRVVKNKATVVLTLLDAYEFRLVRQNGRWLINEILNTSAE